MTTTTRSINWLGLWTLYCKEVRRFMKVYNQTLIAPMVSALLLFAIFFLAMGDHKPDVRGIPFAQFVIPGLIMMTIVQNAFANTSSSLIMGKVLGTVIDYLLPPISPGEMTFAMVAGGITRGFLCGISVTVAMAMLVHIPMHSIGLAVVYVLLASSMLSLIGMLAGIFADTFDQMSAVTSYVITPLSFLSGTFYSVHNLPAFWQHFNWFNPFFYMIDGFRYALTGYSDAAISTGLVVLVISNIVLYLITQRLITKGYRLKS